MKVTKKQLKRIINEEIVRKLSENKAYDRLYAKYDDISDMHSMTDGSNALANDLTDDQYDQMDGYTQDLDWDEQLDWINDNHPQWLEAIAAALPKEKKKKGKKKKGKKSMPVPTWFEGNFWDSGRGKADMDNYQTDLAAAKQFDYLLSMVGYNRDYRYQGVLERLGPDGIKERINDAKEYITNGSGLYARDLPADPVYPEEGPSRKGVLNIIIAMAEAASPVGSHQGTRWTGEHYFYGQPENDKEANALSEIINIITDALRYR